MNAISELINAVQNKHLEHIEQLLTQNFSSETNDHSEIMDEIRQLLLVSDFANARCTEINLLCYAASQGYGMLVSWLLEHGAKPNNTNDTLSTPLHLAATNGHHTIVKLLLVHSADPNLRDAAYVEGRGNSNHTPLHLAVFENYMNIVELLLNAGADPNISNSRQKTPLHTAVEEENEEILALLLTHTTDPNASDSEMHTPLHKAADVGNKNIVVLLLDNGASINSQEEAGLTPLHYAAAEAHEAVVALLLSRGADPNILSSDHIAPLYAAAFEGSQRIVSLLLNAGVSVHSGPEAIEDPLHVAARHGHDKIVEMLLNNGANICLQNQRHETPLLLALRGHKKTIQLLLRRGAYSYRNTQVEIIISQLWKNIDTDANFKFYTTLLLAGVCVPEDQILPAPLAQTQKTIEIAVKAWLAPLNLSVALYQRVTPDVVRALPRLLQWAEAIQLLKAKRERTCNEIVESMHLHSDNESERFKGSLLASRVVMLKLSEANILLRELLDLVEDSLIQQALVQTLRQCYPIPYAVANRIAAKVTNKPEEYRLLYDTIFENAQSVNYEPSLTRSM